MGGFGSGKRSWKGGWTRSRKRTKLMISPLKGVEFTEIVKACKLRPDGIVSVESARLTLSESGTVLHIDMTKPEDKLMFDTFKIAVVPCYFGGVRYFIHCPACQKRFVRLHGYKNYLVCRKCLKMAYWSQNETKARRLWKKCEAVKKKLNNDPDTKPKWMRKKSFERLRREYLDLKEKEEMAEFFSLRNNKTVNRMFEKHEFAECAIEDFLFKNFPL